MSLSPPPLPAAPRRSGGFVNVLAYISLALGVLGVASGLLQVLSLSFMRPESMLQSLADAGLELPALMKWAFENLQLLNGLSLLSSILFTWVSWGLLKRREWARLGFIAFLVFGALGGFFGALMFSQTMAWLNAQVAMAGAEDPALALTQNATRAVLIGSAIVIAGIHAWLAWKLCTRPIRAEFVPA